MRLAVDLSHFVLAFDLSHVVLLELPSLQRGAGCQMSCKCARV